MSNPVPGTDTKPWYKHFWPWFLMALPAAVVVAGLSTAYIANRHADDLVVDDYYKDGLAINVQLAKKQRAAELGLSARLHFSEDIFTVPLVRVSPGLYRGSMGQQIIPNWHWILQGLRRDDWRLDGEVQAADIDNVAPG